MYYLNRGDNSCLGVGWKNGCFVNWWCPRKASDVLIFSDRCHFNDVMPSL